MHMADEGLPPESTAQTFADPIWAPKYLVFWSTLLYQLGVQNGISPKRIGAEV